MRDLLAWWPFDEGEGATAADRLSQVPDRIDNNFNRPEWKPGIGGSALFCDGYSTWVVREAKRAPLLSPDGFSIEARLAVATYPVSTAGVVNQHIYPESGFLLAVSKHGQWGLQLAVEGVWHAVWAEAPLPKGAWVHIAATFGKRDGVRLYLGGKQMGRGATLHGDFEQATDADLVLGRHNDSPAIAGIFPTGVFHGLLDEVKIHGRALLPDEIEGPDLMGIDPPDFSVPQNRFLGDPHRPRYHLIPPANWTNEPHGPIHWKGRYHVFYQANPNGPYWGQIHWGHAVSDDLVRWEHPPPALSPEPGPDEAGIWSGCTVVKDGRVAAIYTGEVRGKQVQNLAWSQEDDLIRWDKIPENPIIPGPPAGFDIVSGFRDPFVWQEGDRWYMIVGSGIRDVGGTVFLYRSSDLVEWVYLGPLFTGKVGETGQFWEMPQFARVGGKHVLIVNEWPGSKRGWYWIGTWKEERFAPETGPILVDLGEHYLSPSVTRDKRGRLLAFGVIKETRSSRDQLAAGWANLMGVPRVFDLDADRMLLTQRPVPELETLRREHLRFESVRVRPGARGLLGTLTWDALELKAVFAPESRGQFGLVFRRSPEAALARGRSPQEDSFQTGSPRTEETLIYYDAWTKRMVVDKSRSSLNPTVERGMGGGPFSLDEGEPLELHVFLDRSVLEVFINGRASLTTRIYPVRADSLLTDLFAANGGVMAASVDVWRIGT